MSHLVPTSHSSGLLFPTEPPQAMLRETSFSSNRKPLNTFRPGPFSIPSRLSPPQQIAGRLPLGEYLKRYPRASDIHAKPIQIPQWLNPHCHPPTFIYNSPHTNHAESPFPYCRAGMARFVVKAEV